MRRNHARSRPRSKRGRFRKRNPIEKVREWITERKKAVKRRDLMLQKVPFCFG